MSITLGLTLFGWHIGAFNIRIDLDQPGNPAQPVVDRGVKRMTRWWTEHMSS